MVEQALEWALTKKDGEFIIWVVLGMLGIYVLLEGINDAWQRWKERGKR